MVLGIVPLPADSCLAHMEDGRGDPDGEAGQMLATSLSQGRAPSRYAASDGESIGGNSQLSSVTV